MTCRCDPTRGHTCPTCLHAIDAAEDDRDHGDDERDSAVADRYETQFLGAA